jgi:hypothetical protein
MADKRENEMNKVTSIVNGTYIRMLDASGNSVQIGKSDFVEAIKTAIGLATVSQNGLLDKKYAPSSSFVLVPNQEIDTGLVYGLVYINHPSSGHSAAFSFTHFIEYTRVISSAGGSISIDNTPNCIYVFKEVNGGTIKIKNNYSENRTISYHIL